MVAEQTKSVEKLACNVEDMEKKALDDLKGVGTDVCPRMLLLAPIVPA